MPDLATVSYLAVPVLFLVLLSLGTIARTRHQSKIDWAAAVREVALPSFGLAGASFQFLCVSWFIVKVATEPILAAGFAAFTFPGTDTKFLSGLMLIGAVYVVLGAWQAYDKAVWGTTEPPQS